MKAKNKKGHKNILVRYGLIVAVMLLFAMFIIIFAGKIVFTSEGEKWRKVGKSETLIEDRVILPKRGNIYTCDEKPLAISEPLYGIYMDFWADGMKKDSLMKYVGDLSVALAKKFPDRSAAQYKTIIVDGWKLREKEERQIAEYKKQGIDKKVKCRSRYVRIIRPDVSYVDLKEIQTYPFLNQRSTRSGLISEEKNSRKKPFGNLATRTVGSVYKDLAKGGASGLELKYDSLLRGMDGVKNRQKIQGKWMDVVEIPAIDGQDIITTIDAGFQDITERELRNKLIETGAESGTAIVMEVKTGEVKALVNLDRMSSGHYAEGNPNAFSYMSEPGSTFKTVTVMAALDDGLITPTDSFHVGKGLYQYKGKWVRDHYWRQGLDRGYYTVKEGIEHSSNIVMSKIAIKAYGDNPKKYVDAIDRIGLRKKLSWDVPVHGIEGTSVIRTPDDKRWSKTSLPWMSFGYETQIPPIYMIMFYNGIANGGKMIKPFFTKRFVKNGKVLREFEAEVVNPKMCKDATLAQIKEMLEGVVIRGTASQAKSEFVPIAGKTGTALIASGGGYDGGSYVSFCGYFPAEDPQYTCFIGVRKPQRLAYGWQTALVLKNIAEKISSRNMRLSPNDCEIDSTLQKKPLMKNGHWDENKRLLSELKLPYSDQGNRSEWIQIRQDGAKVEVQPLEVKRQVVPNVKGMGARDAVYLLEKSGLKVTLSGMGKVVAQSFQPGSKLVKGTTINISLQ
ncbi:MAG: transpeptidase family protein [Dysgonamonadaceae bacterium]|nr:transpeptidase family protein [Dysgonamonadaceae bacterium]